VLPKQRIGETLWHLITVFGMEQMTNLLKLSERELRDVPGGRRELSPADAERIIELAFIYDSISFVFAEKAAMSWLLGSNSYLDGARPLDAVWRGATAEAYAAVQVARAGGFS